MASTLEVEVELKSCPHDIWISLKDSTTVFPQALPHHYTGIDIIEGDGYSPGTVRLVKFVPEISDIKSTTEKIESVDGETKTVVYSVVDGDMIKFYKNFKGKTSVSPNPKGEGTLVKWSCEYDKASEDVPNPDLIKDFAVNTFKELDAYLQKTN